MLSQFSICLSLLVFATARQHDQRNDCLETRFRGKSDKDTNINQHTLTYGTIPQRWGSAKIVDYAPHHTHDATASSQECSQMICVACGWRPPKLNLFDPESKIQGVEQCLYLSAFTPPKKTDLYTPSLLQGETHRDSEALLPVVFHIHHGQFMYGFKVEHGEVKNVVSRGIVVSNANFRLGALGFLAHPDIQQVNVGQQDLVLALGWVQRYICSFGGNHHQVTITGSSTGAAQALLLVASENTAGLFRGAWINSMTSFGMPDFFGKDVDTVFEKEVQSGMLSVGCGTLQCLQEMRVKQLLLSLLEAKFPLVQLTKHAVQAMPSRSFTAFDGEVIPDMNRAACDNTISKRPVHLVVGQGKDELDSLKFQFHLPKLVKNLVATRAESIAATDDTTRCMQAEVLKAQGVQETAEDAMFNFGSYLSGSSSGLGGGPRWHFLMTAPASKTKRTWHTLAELLCWNPDPKEDTAQYDRLTKAFVYGNASPELMTYVHQNFIHFSQTGFPDDASWMQTAPVQQGEIGGLPSKIMDQAPLSTEPYNSYHHSNYTIHFLHTLSCSKSDALPLSETIESCKKRSSAQSILENSKLSEFQEQLSTVKKSDLLFSLEMMKAFHPAKLLPEMLQTSFGE